ncbi:MAG TPA: hypothetical protein VGM94_12840 [Galbitalea sp.]
MADEGPTTAGSIVGKLKMDRDQWLRDKEATIADARELGQLDPTITVHANVAEALAQLEALHAASGDTSTISTTTVGTSVTTGAAAKIDAVSAAEARLAAAEVKQAAAADLATSAGDRLWRTEQSLSASAAEKAAAQDKATRATEKADLAALALTAAEDALAQAQQKAAQTALEDAGAQETQAKATDNAGKSMSRIQAIFTAIVALGPGLIPIAGFAVSAGAAISAMAGVAVLAVLGIRNELKDGSADSAEFAAGIASLKTDVSQLEATAAKGVLGGFSTVVAELNADMPELNSETALYSKVLGAIAATGFGGLLSSFHALAPLIIDVDSYLLSTVGRLSQFAASPGMRQFVTYAQQNLPNVENLLDSLIDTAFNLLAAFAPWGTLVVDVVTAVSNVISAVPTPILSTLIELALGGSLAFKAWTSIPAMFMSIAATIGATAVAEDGATVATGALGAAIDFMEGPIGWVVAGLGALVAVFLASSAAAGVSTKAVNSYTAALQQDNGVIGENTRLQAAKNLQDSGAIDAAKKLGISTLTLVSASLGDAAAKKVVTTALDVQHKKLDEVSKSTLDSVNGGVRMTAAQRELGGNIAIVTDAIGTQNKDLKASKSAYDDLQVASGALVGTNQQQADAYARLANEEDAATNAGKLWKSQLDILNGSSQSLEQANIALAGDFQNMTTTIINNMKQMGAAAAHSLNISTAGGLANHQLVLQAIQDAETQSQAIISSEGDTAKAREDGRQALIKSRQAIIDHAVAAGLDRDAVTKLVDSELTIPAHVSSTVTVNTSAAEASFNALKAMFAALKNVTVHVGATGSVSYSTQGGRVNFFAEGGTVGGTVHGAGTTTSDSNIVALSNDEEVTRASRAQQYRPMLKAINNGTPTDVRAAASKLSGPTAPSKVDSSTTNYFEINEATNATAVAQLVAHYQLTLRA